MKRIVSTRTVVVFLVAGAMGGIWGLLSKNAAPRIPEVTRKAFESASERWRKANVRSYVVEVRVNSARVETFRVDVRDGLAHSATLNGQPITQSRVFDTWSIPGMLYTIGEDLSAFENHESGKDGGGTANSRLRCDFDPELGIPWRYSKSTWGTTRGVSWEITKFEKQ